MKKKSVDTSVDQLYAFAFTQLDAVRARLGGLAIVMDIGKSNGNGGAEDDVVTARCCSVESCAATSVAARQIREDWHALLAEIVAL